jgi:hypothetical protein
MMPKGSETVFAAINLAMRSTVGRTLQATSLHRLTCSDYVRWLRPMRVVFIS